jgi:hypothetical protein
MGRDHCLQPAGDGVRRRLPAQRGNDRRLGAQPSHDGLPPVRVSPGGSRSRGSGSGGHGAGGDQDDAAGPGNSGLFPVAVSGPTDIRDGRLEAGSRTAHYRGRRFGLPPRRRPDPVRARARRGAHRRHRAGQRGDRGAGQRRAAFPSDGRYQRGAKRRHGPRGHRRVDRAGLGRHHAGSPDGPGRRGSGERRRGDAAHSRARVAGGAAARAGPRRRGQGGLCGGATEQSETRARCSEWPRPRRLPETVLRRGRPTRNSWR